MKKKVLSLILIVVLALSFSLVTAVPATSNTETIIEVSQPVQVTNSQNYERGQSIINDGTYYWLFYGRSAGETGPFSDPLGNPDSHDYVVYYKKADTIANLAGASAVEVTVDGVDHNMNLYLGETDAAYFNGEVWVFASHDTGSSSCDLYAWRTTDGTSWTETDPIVTGLPHGAAHFAVTTCDEDLWVAYQTGNQWKTICYDGSTWSGELDLVSGYGTGKFYVEDSSLYFAVAQKTSISIHQYSGSSWSSLNSKSLTTEYAYDASLLKRGSYYMFVYAPLPTDWSYQWIKGYVGTSLNTLLSGGIEVIITAGEYGSNTWIDMWPTGFTDDGSNSYLFFTSERKPNDTSSEIAGNIWYLPVDWDVTHDHYTYIQNAIDAATSTTINVAAGTYDEEVVINKSLTLISDTGDYRTTGVILNGPIALNNVQNVTVQGFKFEDYTPNGYAHVIYTVGTADDITISANSFNNCEGLNIHIYYGGETWFNNWTITDNKITNVTGTSASGIWVQRLTNSTICNNVISNTTYAGMILDRIENVTVSNNNISNTPRKGIQVASSLNCNVVIEDNYITNTNTSHDADEGAITIYPDVTNIHIINNTLTANYQGFTVRDKDGTVTDVHVNFNNIYGNDGFGIGNFARGGGMIDAPSNWWGDASGPDHSSNPGGQGDAVSDGVGYNPWITSLAYTGGPQPTSSVNLEATLYDSSGFTAGAGAKIFFDYNDSKGYAITDSNGIATLDIGSIPIEVYDVRASLGPDCIPVESLLAVYDPSAGFVTGGGWIDSPPNAYMPMPRPAGTVIVTPVDVGIDWSTADTRYNGYVDFVSGPNTPPLGLGSLEMGSTDTSDKAQLFNYEHMGTLLADIDNITYATYRDSGSTNPPAQYPAINIEVDYVGDGNSYTTLVWEPIYAYGPSNMTLDTWQTWDTMAPSQTGFDGGWWSTKNIPGVCAFNCFVDWDTIIQNNPDAKIKYGFGLNIGSGWNGVFTGAVDALAITVNSETTTYDFEPVTPPTGKATFGFVSKYKKGLTVPEGNTEFVFKAADLNFHSTNYDWLVVTGSDYARFKGTGTINGEGEYKFMLWAGDGDPDTFRIKIWYEVDDTEYVVYDNGSDQEISGGSIVVHTSKK